MTTSSNKSTVRILVAVVVILVVMNSYLLFINMSDNSDNLIIEIPNQRLEETLVNEIYYNDLVACNLSERILLLEAGNSTNIIIGSFTNIEDWKQNCQDKAVEKKTLLEQEFLKN